MTTFVTLRIADDDEAQQFLDDMNEYPGKPLLTPVQEHTVYATLVSTHNTRGTRSLTRSTSMDEQERLRLQAQMSDRWYGYCRNCGGQEPTEVLIQMEGFCTSECDREWSESHPRQ